MPCTQKELEQIEKQTLARTLNERRHARTQLPEAPPEWRTEYQRDRDG